MIVGRHIVFLLLAFITTFTPTCMIHFHAFVKNDHLYLVLIKFGPKCAKKIRCCMTASIFLNFELWWNFYRTPQWMTPKPASTQIKASHLLRWKTISTMSCTKAIMVLHIGTHALPLQRGRTKNNHPCPRSEDATGGVFHVLSCKATKHSRIALIT